MRKLYITQWNQLSGARGYSVNVEDWEAGRSCISVKDTTTCGVDSLPEVTGE